MIKLVDRSKAPSFTSFCDYKNKMTDKNTLKCNYSIVHLNEKYDITTEIREQKIPSFGKRHLQSIILFLSLSVSVMVRAQFSVAIVAMTDTRHNSKTEMNEGIIRSHDKEDDHRTENINKINNSIDTRHHGKHAAISLSTVYRTYDWSKSVQEMVTFSFFVGYTITQIPMGVISQRYGGKLPILVALFTNGVLNFLTPWFAIAGWWCVCLSRFFQGLTQGALYPSIQTTLAKWAPISERGRFCTQVFTGAQFGTIIAFPISGTLAGIPMLGWPSSFWLVGTICMLCFVLLAIFGAATPDQHPTISKSEKEYIRGFDENKHRAEHVTPWKDILKSAPVWGMVVAHAGSTFCYLFLLVEMPLYLSKILHFNIKNSGLLSSLPYVAMFSFGIFMGKITDFTINRGYVGKANVRRIANTIGMVASGVFMIAFSFAENVTLAIILLILSVALHAAVKVGFLVNQIDLSPNFAGTLMSIANLVGNFISLLVPILVSTIVKDVENQEQWQIVFGIAGAISILANFVFLLLIKTETQPWDSQSVACDNNSLKSTENNNTTPATLVT